MNGEARPWTLGFEGEGNTPKVEQNFGSKRKVQPLDLKLDDRPVQPHDIPL